MAGEDNGSIPVPPYVSYRTFRNFLDELRQGIPGRIDRSEISKLSGTVQGHLLASLRYFDLITDDGIPTTRLNSLVNTEGEARKDALASLLNDSYPWLFEDPAFSLSNATSLQFMEKFRESKASGDTVRKCASFFLAAAKDAGLEVSPRIRITQGARARANQPKASGPKKPPPRTPNLAQEPLSKAHAMEPPRSAQSWAEMLLAKFPTFDPDWPDDVKIKWFEAFDRLMESGREAYEEPTYEEEVDP